MSEEKKDVKKKGISRREFLKDAGLVVGGISTAAVLSGCKTPAAEMITTTATATVTTTKTAPMVTTTQTQVAATTITSPPTTVTTTVTPTPNPPVTTLTINGQQYPVQVDANWTLQRTLQFKLGLTGNAKTMCDRGVCGSCTVIIDGRAVLSCTTLTIECAGKKIETIEGIAAAKHPLIDAFVNRDAMQCGYCTPGFLTAAKALLDKNKNPTADDITQALGGQICCCGTYPRHTLAIMDAAAKLRGG